MAEKRFMVRQWEDIKKAGGLSASIEQITDILQGDSDMPLSRQEVLDRVAGYFNACLKIVEDEETGEQVTTWKRNPTKSGLALALGVDKQTLLDMVRGLNSANKPYGADSFPHNRRVHSEDFDILRKAYAIIENFYEEQLGQNKNNAGVIYWLNNASNSKWSNEQEFKFGRLPEAQRDIISADDLIPLRDDAENMEDAEETSVAENKLPFED